MSVLYVDYNSKSCWFWSLSSLLLVSHTSRARHSRRQRPFVPCRWHIRGIKEDSFHHRRVSVQARELSCQQFAAIKRKVSPSEEVSVIQLHLIPPMTVLRVNWTTMTNVKQLAELRERSILWNLAPRRGRWVSRNGEDVPQGSVENGVISMCALSSSSSTTPLKYTMQLDPTHQRHHSLSLPLFVTKCSSQKLKPTWRRSKNQETATWILHSSQCRHQNTGSSSYHCCSWEACQTSWDLIGAVNLLYRLYLPVAYPSLWQILLHLLPFICRNGTLPPGGSGRSNLGKVIKMSWRWAGVGVVLRAGCFLWRGCLLSRSLSDLRFMF